MNQITEIQHQINDPLVIPMNQNLGIPPIINNQANIPINANLQMGFPQKIGNNSQNEDTSKYIYF